jgi:hypothetical protein
MPISKLTSPDRVFLSIVVSEDKELPYVLMYAIFHRQAKQGSSSLGWGKAVSV